MLTQSSSDVPNAQSCMWSMAADAAEAADDAPRALMIAAPRCCTVGMNVSLSNEPQYVEVRFKNTRKEFYKNSDLIGLNVGDIVSVEALTGFHVGVVSLTGELVRLQMKKYN